MVMTANIMIVSLAVGIGLACAFVAALGIAYNAGREKGKVEGIKEVHQLHAAMNTVDRKKLEDICKTYQMQLAKQSQFMERMAQSQALSNLDIRGN